MTYRLAFTEDPSELLRVAGKHLAAEPVLTTVVFRYRSDAARVDTVNAELRRRLLRSGAAVIGRTEIDGAVWLKLTLLNPHASTADVDALLDLVCAAGAAVRTETPA